MHAYPVPPRPPGRTPPAADEEGRADGLGVTRRQIQPLEVRIRLAAAAGERGGGAREREWAETADGRLFWGLPMAAATARRRAATTTRGEARRGGELGGRRGRPRVACWGERSGEGKRVLCCFSYTVVQTILRYECIHTFYAPKNNSASV